jgi:hypothetical protein
LAIYSAQPRSYIPVLTEYRDKPTEFHAPTPAELKARGRRNIAIALALALFMIFVFVTMITRGSAG